MSENVKLIVCDVDGTLLKKGEKQLPETVFKMIETLNAKNILFAVASGRSPSELKKLFAKTADKIIFICLDGALAFYRDTVLYEERIKEPVLKKLFDMTLKKPDVSTVAYARDCIYADICCDEHRNRILNTSNHVFDLIGLREPIYKISLCGNSRGTIEKARLYLLNNRLLKSIYSNDFWHEFAANETDKGNALDFIQQRFNINKSQTAVFGDNINDTGLMRNAVQSYAVEGAKPEILRLAKFKTTDPIREILRITEGSN